jgi:hypothetical protein
VSFTDKATDAGPEQVMKLWPDAEFPEVLESRQAADIANTSPRKEFNNIGKVVSRPVVVQVFMRDIVNVLMQQRIDISCCSRIIEKILGAS